MKKITCFCAVLIMAGSFVSCMKHDTLSTTNTGTNTLGVAGGQFKISLYFDDNRDKTSNFSGYSFEFISGGIVKATSGTTVTNGTWSESGNRFQITFSQSPLDKLSHNWVIEEKTTSNMKFRDDNTSENEKVYFTRL